MDNNYDTVTSDWAEMYEEYCRESDRLFFEWQDQMRYEEQELERRIDMQDIQSGEGW